MTRVTLIAATRFFLDSATDAAFDRTGKTWNPDLRGTVDGPLFTNSDQHQASLLSEFAGRACYESFDQPNEGTQANRDYLAHILEVKHESVLEHGSATFYITDASRAFTHELVRHRHLSYSQLSQRYARLDDSAKPVIPPLLQGNPQAEDMIRSAWIVATQTYEELVAIGESIARDQGQSGTGRRKAAREAARGVLPNMTPTAIVVTGNHRAWREFLTKRATIHADAEMSEIAVKLYDYPSGRYGAEIANLNVTIADKEVVIDRQAAILRRVRQMAVDKARDNTLMDPRRLLAVLNELPEDG